MYYSESSEQLHPPAPAALVLVTLFLSVAVEFIPLPAALLPYKPSFPMLVLVYWAVYQPALVNYFAAVVIGLIMDLADHAPLGFNAMSGAVAVFLVNMFSNRFILLTGLAQAMHVFFILAAAQLCLHALGYLDKHSAQPPLSWRLFIPGVSAMLLWFMLPILIRNLRYFVLGKRERYAAYE